MKVKVSIIRVLDFLRMRESGEGNSRSGVTVKLVVGGKWMSNSKRQAGASVKTFSAIDSDCRC